MRDGGRRVGLDEVLVALFGESERRRQRATRAGGCGEGEEADASPLPALDGTSFSVRRGGVQPEGAARPEGAGAGGGRDGGWDRWEEDAGEEGEDDDEGDDERWDIEDLGQVLAFHPALYYSWVFSRQELYWALADRERMYLPEQLSMAALYLEIDLRHEPELFWIVLQSVVAPLPPYWQVLRERNRDWDKAWVCVRECARKRERPQESRPSHPTGYVTHTNQVSLSSRSLSLCVCVCVCVSYTSFWRYQRPARPTGRSSLTRTESPTTTTPLTTPQPTDTLRPSTLHSSATRCERW